MIGGSPGKLEERVHSHIHKRPSGALQLRSIIVEVVLTSDHITRHHVDLDEGPNIPGKAGADAHLLVIDQRAIEPGSAVGVAKMRAHSIALSTDVRPRTAT